MIKYRNHITTLFTVSAILAATSSWAYGAWTQGCCAGPTGQHEGHGGQADAQKPVTATVKNGVQVLTVTVDRGYSPSSFSVKAGMPVELTFKLGKSPGCASTVNFPSLKIKQEIAQGKGSVIKFTPKQAGDIAFECGMGMYKGKIVAK